MMQRMYDYCVKSRGLAENIVTFSKSKNKISILGYDDLCNADKKIVENQTYDMDTDTEVANFIKTLPPYERKIVEMRMIVPAFLMNDQPRSHIERRTLPTVGICSTTLIFAGTIFSSLRISYFIKLISSRIFRKFFITKREIFYFGLCLLVFFLPFQSGFRDILLAFSERNSVPEVLHM